MKIVVEIANGTLRAVYTDYPGEVDVDTSFADDRGIWFVPASSRKQIANGAKYSC